MRHGYIKIYKKQKKNATITAAPRATKLILEVVAAPAAAPVGEGAAAAAPVGEGAAGLTSQQVDFMFASVAPAAVAVILKALGLSLNPAPHANW